MESLSDDSRPATRGDVRSLGSRISGLDGSMGAVEGRMGSLEGRVNALDGRVDALDGKVTVLDGKFTGMAIRLADLQARRIEDKREIIDQIKRSASEIMNKVDAFAGKTQDQERQGIVFDKILKKNRATLDDHEARIRAIEKGPHPH